MSSVIKHQVLLSGVMSIKTGRAVKDFDRSGGEKHAAEVSSGVDGLRAEAPMCAW